ncbi:early nodulin-like protein 12 isoform X1 [Physcomitrium patens]|nr:blue copper protein-like isoform X1 [Physcomitrium patens]|eukprot:XP_024380119.1 blue copper protein-like isoform X1 [Physcomitrella patens]
MVYDGACTEAHVSLQFPSKKTHSCEEMEVAAAAAAATAVPRRIAMMGKPYGTMSKVASVVFMLIASMACAVTAKEFTVGDTTGWDFAPNSSFYNDWANGLKFVPGDKIVFKYIPSDHNVQEVTESDYVSCSSLNPLAEYESGNDIVTLPKPGTHYYICGFLGHCDQGGMRMKITVRGAYAPQSVHGGATSPTGDLPSPMTGMDPGLPSADTATVLPQGNHERALTPAAVPVTVPGHSAACSSRELAIFKRRRPFFILMGGAAAIFPLLWK